MRMNHWSDKLLLTDLYEFTMAAAYFSHGMFAPATFSLFIREYPDDRAYFVSAGLEDVLELLEEFRFRPEDIDCLESTTLFSTEFLQYLSDLRFIGEVWAVPEGRIFFRNEPILEVTAPIPMAQLVETLVLNTIGFQVMIATKASRCVHAAQGRRLVDFSLRRTQGADAGLKVARASFLAGFDATSNVLAGKTYGIPTAGTMAHSFVTSFPEEADAPFLDIAYKLVKYDGRPVLKLSSGKKTLVEEKQVFRSRRNGVWAGDAIALNREHLDGEPLLELAMNAGIRAQRRRSLSEIRERFAGEFADLPEAHKALKDPALYPVGLSEELERMQSETVQAVVGKELGES